VVIMARCIGALWFKPEGRGFEKRGGELLLSIYLNFTAALFLKIIQSLAK
jgi:hypothetical protein